MQPLRLASAGSRIDRSKLVRFTFDGKSYQGFAGDTLASALIANNVKLFGRSFKYHRPRGCLTAGSEEPNALVELRTGSRREPNSRATMIEVFDGLEANSQNRFPSLKFDVLSANQLIAPFLTAGFYYKTFMWPASLWESVYEKIIRRSSGLGRAAQDPDPDSYEHAHGHCDVLIAGAGPAGLSAALAAARSGLRVILVEEQSCAGGALSPDGTTINDVDGFEWLENTIEELDQLENVTVMMRTQLFGYYDHNVCAALERVSDHLGEPANGQPRQRMWTIRAKEIVLACGSHERPMTFDNNDRPGVMLSSAVRRFVERYGATPGQNIIICTNNDDAYATAMVLHNNAVNVAMIADARSGLPAAAQPAIDAGIRCEKNMLPAKAHGSAAVNGLSLQRVDGTFAEKVDCDCIAMSGGFSPDVNLFSQTGATPVWREDICGFVPDKSTRRERSAGAGNGAFDLATCLEEGFAAGVEAARSVGGNIDDAGQPPKADANEITPPAAVWRCPGNGKAFVDFQNDVTAKDITLAHQEGFVSVEHLKRYTTLGMATDQGKTSNVNGIAMLAAARGDDMASTGTTRFRPPCSPVAIGAFAGHERGKQFQPTRRTAMHEAHEKLGAVFVETGQWLRPQYYPRPGEDIMNAIWRESEQVRKTAGICDVSSLGKIEIFGDDAAEFLNRLYINGWKLLAPGKARYGIMLREDGNVFDDGTTSRLADDHFLMTTTTANAARVLAHMEHGAQVLWPDLKVHFCSATEQWCGVAVAGPNARKVLADAFDDAIDISNEALPFMGVATFKWRGVTARIFRISFSGELAFEINVPWRFGVSMWEAIMDAGRPHDLIPYGSEALGVLRIEKGHVAGNELDGRTTAADMGLGRMMSSKKTYIGQKMTARQGMTTPERATLVGIKIAQSSGRIRGGAHLVRDKNDTNSETSLGWVTSVANSPAMGCWIALGYLHGGLGEYQGKRLHAVYPMLDEAVEVEICSPHFFDPKGERLHV